MSTLLQDLMHRSPHELFDEWFASAARYEGTDVNAMALATVDEHGMPQARMVLLKEHSHDEFIFYTNNESRKGQALRLHPRAALLFFWHGQRRQVLIEGQVRQMSQEESSPYYYSRPRDSRIGAWASRQSQPMESYEWFRGQVAARQAEFAERDPPIPPYWRGYCLRPGRIEFWQEGEFRLHQRLAFTGDEAGQWQATMLQP